MSHEPLVFLSGSFKGSLLRWATVDKEGFAIVSMFRRIESLLWEGVHIFTDHRNLAYIFNAEACASSVSKALAQRLEGGKVFLGNTGTLFDTFRVIATRREPRKLRRGELLGNRFQLRLRDVDYLPELPEKRSPVGSPPIR